MTPINMYLLPVVPAPCLSQKKMPVGDAKSLIILKLKNQPERLPTIPQRTKCSCRLPNSVKKLPVSGRLSSPALFRSWYFQNNLLCLLFECKNRANDTALH